MNDKGLPRRPQALRTRQDVPSLRARMMVDGSGVVARDYRRDVHHVAGRVLFRAWRKNERANNRYTLAA